MTGKSIQQFQDKQQDKLQDDLTVIQTKSSTGKSVQHDKTIFIKPEQLDYESLMFTGLNSSGLNSSGYKGSDFNSSALNYSDKTKIFTAENKTKIAVPAVIKVGSIIRNRFVLDEILGIGGMGKVYKAIDLRKKEAQDKNPYIAIKVLNDEFRDHPEALIALQREARKSQQLSHPNIVNVHDFDRDGEMVYMTMELLQGKSLDRVIAEDYPNGMPIEQATPIINSVSNAVFYAHQHGIIHSDLKPSNIFVTNDNVAKIFDFGIARACHTRATHTSANKDEQIEINSDDKDLTLFDPTQLCALTPTYASLEMLQGHAPEQHDDLYSIACVFYELLSGQHPYKRLPADEAKKQKLQARRIPSISKFKLRALQNSLDLVGKNRYETVELFIRAFNQKKRIWLSVTSVILAIILSISAVFFPQFKEYYHNYQQESFIFSVNQSDFKNNPDAVEIIKTYINKLDAQTKIYVLDNIKNNWLTIINEKIDSLIDDREHLYQYDKALQLLIIAQQYYPDSAQVARMFDLYEKKKYILLNQLNNQFNELLEIAQISGFRDIKEQQQILAIINAVKQIEVKHPLVKDERLLLIYEESIERLMTEHHTEKAHKLLLSAESVFKDNISLQNLKHRLKALTSENNQQNSDVHAENISNDNISSLKLELTQLIENASINSQWEKRVTVIYEQLFNKLGYRSVWINEKKQALSTLFLRHSVAMRDKQRLTEARYFLDKAKQYNEQLFGLNDEETILLSLENIVRVKYNAKQQLVEIEGLKTSLNTQLKAHKMKSAIRSYKKLQRILGRNDPYIAGDARQAIAQAYYKQARQLFVEKNYDKSLLIIKLGLKFERHHYGLRTLHRKVRKHLKLVKESQLLAEQSVE